MVSHHATWIADLGAEFVYSFGKDFFKDVLMVIEIYGSSDDLLSI